MTDTIIKMLEKIILPEYQLSVKKKSTSRIVDILEKKNEKNTFLCQGVQFEIKKSNVSFIGFSFERERDKNQLHPIFPYFNMTEKGICTQSDAVLFYQQNEPRILYVLLIELKSESIKGSLPQLRAARVFVQFILERIKVTRNVQLPTIEYRGVRFCTPRIPNEGTTRKKEISYPKVQEIKVEYEGDNNELLHTLHACHYCYDIQDFLF